MHLVTHVNRSKRVAKINMIFMIAIERIQIISMAICTKKYHSVFVRYSLLNESIPRKRPLSTHSVASVS